MKYYLIAGEASGDLHGSNLIHALKKEDPSAIFRCWGGDLMAAAGSTLVKHYRELAFMGFLEVVKNLPAILRNFRLCKKDVLDFQPDALILIDYPGFNLRLATWAKKQGIQVFYYISPQLWAWHTSRVKIIREAVDRMFVILPFEVDFYKKHGVEVEFAGHPLMDVISENRGQAELDFFEKNGLKKGKHIIALLPGSRRQEIARMLGTMLQIPPLFTDYQFVVAGAPAVERIFYESFLQENRGVFLVENQTYDLLRHATAALVTSGTATLETALFNVPQVVCYRGNKLSFLLARLLVNPNLKFIAMVNLLAEKRLVAELIQVDLSVEKLVAELKKLLESETRREILEGYAEIRKQLGTPGASERVAKRMIELRYPR